MIISCTPVTTCCVVWREQWLAMPIILMLQFIYLSKVPQPSYLYYGNPFTDKMPSWYWIVPLDVTWLCELPQMIWIFSCDQAALRMAISVCPSVRLSVCDTFLTMFPSSYHHEIFRSYYQWQKWCLCKKSRSEVKGQGHRGHDPI